MSAPTAVSPARASRDVARELASAALELVCLPPRAALYLVRHRRLVRELRADLERPSSIDECAFDGRLPARALRIFVSCAEASGELHALNLIAALERELAARGAPRPQFFGLGGKRLADAGVEVLADPVERATMGFDRVLRALPFYLGVLKHCALELRSRAPDVAVAIDSPALHVPLGRIARRAQVPFVHFVTPQYWGWAPWRVDRYRRAVDRALSILPFEKRWFEARGVNCVHVGHPLLDALPRDVPPFEAPERTRLALLGGSRESVMRRNFPWMLALAAELARERPELRVVVPHERAELGPELERLALETLRLASLPSWLSIELGALHRSLGTATAAFAVSGTALLDLVHHRLPTVVVYRVASSRQVWLSKYFLTAPYFASINLLAARELVPEFCFAGDGPREAVRAALVRALDDAPWRRQCRQGLELAAERLGPRGATERAARVVLSLAKTGRA